MTDLLIRHPTRYLAERAYILDVMLGDFLGLSFEVVPEVRDDISIMFPDTRAELCLAEVLFRTPDADWLQPRSLPSTALEEWRLPETIIATTNLESETVPVIFGRRLQSGGYISHRAGMIDLGLDILGSAFFMLTRYEEACCPVLDKIGRFPANASLAERSGFQSRPIVNEYLEILFACLQHLHPGIKRKSHRYHLVVSHDVDRIFDTRNVAWSTVGKNAFGDLVKRRDIALAAKRVCSKAWSSGGDIRLQPSNTFDFIMNCSEQHNIKSSFYFIVYQGTEGFDADYTMEMPGVRALIRHIGARGHELGLHASYGSYQSPEQIAAEFSTLRSVADEEGISQDVWGGRQHYLRWEAVTTWQGWQEAGLDFDSTLTYPEVVGFRSGTCFEYSVFDLHSRSMMKLRERPLVVMETALFSDRYMNLSAADALDTIARLSSTCRRFGGSFTLLWHNDSLTLRRQKRLYRCVLDAVSS